VNRRKVQRLESRRETRDIYKVVGCLMAYRLCALTSAQLGQVHATVSLHRRLSSDSGKPTMVLNNLCHHSTSILIPFYSLFGSVNPFPIVTSISAVTAF